MSSGERVFRRGVGVGVSGVKVRGGWSRAVRRAVARGGWWEGGRVGMWGRERVAVVCGMFRVERRVSWMVVGGGVDILVRVVLIGKGLMIDRNIIQI